MTTWERLTLLIEMREEREKGWQWYSYEPTPSHPTELAMKVTANEEQRERQRDLANVESAMAGYRRKRLAAT